MGVNSFSYLYLSSYDDFKSILCFIEMKLISKFNLQILIIFLLSPWYIKDLYLIIPIHLITSDAFGKKGNKSNNELPAIPPDSVLSIFVKLLSMKLVIDVTGDLKVKKKVLKEGEGTVTANEGATVTSKYLRY